MWSASNKTSRHIPQWSLANGILARLIYAVAANWEVPLEDCILLKIVEKAKACSFLLAKPCTALIPPRTTFRYPSHPVSLCLGQTSFNLWRVLCVFRSAFGVTKNERICTRFSWEVFPWAVCQFATSVPSNIWICFGSILPVILLIVSLFIKKSLFGATGFVAVLAGQACCWASQCGLPLHITPVWTPFCLRHSWEMLRMAVEGTRWNKGLFRSLCERKCISTLRLQGRPLVSAAGRKG